MRWIAKEEHHTYSQLPVTYRTASDSQAMLLIHFDELTSWVDRTS